MKIGVIIPVYSQIPTKLCYSISQHTNYEISWHLYLHRNEMDFLYHFLGLCNYLNAKTHACMVNRGLSRTWNDGIVEAIFSGCDVIIICNDDVIFKPGCFDVLVQSALTADRSGIVTCLGEELIDGKIEPVCQGFAVFAMNIQVILKVGFFDENIVPAYFEDVDYEFRCNNYGLEIYCVQQILVEHTRSASIKISESTRLIIEENKFKNEQYMIKKWNIVFRDRYIANYSSPFDSDVGNKICFIDKCFPYGHGYDRDDISLFNKVVHDYNVLAYFSGDSYIYQEGFIEDNGALISVVGTPSTLYGPYRYLDVGRYELTLRGSWSSVFNSIVDIAKDMGKQIMFWNLPGYVDKICSFMFEIESPVYNFEVRLFIDPQDEIVFYGYQIKKLMV